MKKRRKNCKAIDKDKIFLWDKVAVLKGRLRGETGIAVGERITSNYGHVIAMRRDNPKARKKDVWFLASNLKLI